jgi:RNA polymerase sigma-70 factor (ECF subfamily)
VDRSHEDSDAELLQRARNGDPAAFRRIVERYEGAVATTVIGMLGPGEDADDVGQETFIRLHRALDEFRGDSSLRTYLTRIATNLSLNALRGRKRRWSRFVSRDDRDAQAREADDAGAGDLREDVEALERRAAVRAAVQGLSPKHRAVVVLRMMEGYSTRETAEILGIAEGTVMSRLHRAMSALEEDLSTWMET